MFKKNIYINYFFFLLVSTQIFFFFSPILNLFSNELTFKIQLLSISFLFQTLIILHIEKKIKFYQVQIIIIFFIIFFCLIINDIFEPLKFDFDDGKKFNQIAKKILNPNIETDQNIFSMQPGYTYFITIFLFFFKDQNKLTQLISVFILICSFSFLYSHIKKKFYKKFSFFLIIIFFLLNIFFTRYILLSMSEWLCASILCILPSLLQKGRFTFIALLCGFIFLIKVNLLLLLFFFILILSYQNQNYKYFFYFSIIGLLPIIINFLLFEKFVFLSSTYQADSTRLNFDLNIFNNIFFLFKYLTTYIGFPDYKDYGSSLIKSFIILFNTSKFAFFSSIFLLPALFYSFVKVFLSENKKFKILLVVFFILAICPNFIFGWAYFPRFQVLNYLSVFIVYFLTKKLIDKSI